MFCFYFKHKSAAIFMAAFTMITGIIGILLCTGKLHIILQPVDYLYFSIFHLSTSIIIISGLIWESLSLISLYQVLHLSTIVAFITHTIIYIPVGKTFSLILISSCFILYCIYNVYLYQKELKLKMKLQLERIYFNDIIYFRNNNILIQ